MRSYFIDCSGSMKIVFYSAGPKNPAVFLCILVANFGAFLFPNFCAVTIADYTQLRRLLASSLVYFHPERVVYFPRNIQFTYTLSLQIPTHSYALYPNYATHIIAKK